MVGRFGACLSQTASSLCCEVDCAGVLVNVCTRGAGPTQNQNKDLIAQSHHATVVRTHKLVKPLRVVCSWGANERELGP